LYFGAFSATCPLTSPVTLHFVDCETDFMKMSEMFPSPTAAKRTGCCVTANEGSADNAAVDAATLTKLRRFMDMIGLLKGCGLRLALRLSKSIQYER
jgi:hypothetical protein